MRVPETCNKNLAPCEAMLEMLFAAPIYSEAVEGAAGAAGAATGAAAGAEVSAGAPESPFGSPLPFAA